MSLPDSRKPHVLVLGGGLAGISAACHLLERGCRVTLVEKRPFLGGRTFSFEHHPLGYDSAAPPESSGSLSEEANSDKAGPSFQVDNGQHVFLGCCTKYIDLLKKLGSYSQAYLQPQLHVEIRRAGEPGKTPKTSTLASVPFLPAPLHILPSFLRYSHLGIGDRLRVFYGLLRVRLTRRHHPSLEVQSFHQWLKAHGQSEIAISRFWDIIILATLNDDSRNVRASMALMVYQEGVLKGRSSANVGFSRVGLSELMGNPGRDLILAGGGSILSGRKVSHLIVEDTAGGSEKMLTGVRLADGETLRGDSYLSALPFGDLATILPPDLADSPFFRGTRELATAPIVNVHIWYDRQVMDTKGEPFVAFLDSPLQWVFDKSRMQGAEPTGPSGQYICVSISGAWDYMEMPKADIRRAVLQEMEAAFPQAAHAQVRDALVIKSPATFRCTPGSASLRPSTTTPIRNLFLAGDWTDTGWPSTMEGAVRSGAAAADAVSSAVPRG